MSVQDIARGNLSHHKLDVRRMAVFILSLSHAYNAVSSLPIVELGNADLIDRDDVLKLISLLRDWEEA